MSAKVRLTVDHEARSATRRNHSATHLLHWALRTVLGEHAQQKGSLVGPDRLRFDFTHNKPLTPEEIRQIEDLVNERTLANYPVQTDVLSMDDARKRGAMMIFEEKYGDVVRMLSMGDSIELCGGTDPAAAGAAADHGDRYEADSDDQGQHDRILGGCGATFVFQEPQ